MLDLAGFMDAVKAPSVPPELAWRSTVVRIDAAEREPFETFCRTTGIAVTDTLHRQLNELPTTRNADESYARWIYLPWRRRVFRLLPPDDYADVVTDRNRDKVTREEQRLLRSKSVGVIGLSVGGEAALTIAQEHLCGRLVLADFDEFELSNLNRLNAGFADLGLPKTRIVARRIAELDPYLEVELYEQGVTESNAPAFLTGLDLLVEECDGLAMKHHIRCLAKERGLDVVYAADERGFLSIEPYSHHDLPIFHGLATAPSGPYLQGLTAWLGGWDALSDRSRRSVERIGTDLAGYPQLAGEARYAAAQVAHVARRLLLGEDLPPFHGHLDIGNLIAK
ncbi:ThiF family adenylyltransferase [Actinomadura barringtoniae]|uniref:ThiF family adenylyltransferase n=1 Tax=Actinomadura barringtoniae TaxID=1427535 RepID=A0A939T9Y8_9ACTN|nr:ThiF family adenylyltransferase [Actinomadura barringtoniae]MBO2454809.1 ThiF family adenylyltransferase [Actinomadura barringtoniae]